MRLICPNCSAQYEVDGSMIPDDGRDVQCSNCGHTWFELPGPRDPEAVTAASEDFLEPDEEDDAYLESVADTKSAHDRDWGEPDESEDDFAEAEEPEPEPDSADEEEEDEDAISAREASRPENLSREVFEDDDDLEPSMSEDSADTSDTRDEEDAPDAAPEDSGDDDDGTEKDETSDAIRALAAAAKAFDEVDDVVEATAPTRQRRPADAAALDILREEAERELSQRRAPPPESIETQPDLGLDDIRNRRTPSRALRARMAHLGEEMPEKPEEKEPEREQTDPKKSRLVSYPSSADDDGYEEPRRDLLPDIEEINSTLKGGARGQADPEGRERSGFRIGFLTMLFVTVAVIFAYAQAPAIARALPEAEPALISFVDWANGIRDQVDGLIGN